MRLRRLSAAGRAAIEISFRALQLRLRGEESDARLFADRLVLATAVIVVMLSAIFALLRVAG